MTAASDSVVFICDPSGPVADDLRLSICGELLAQIQEAAGVRAVEEQDVDDGTAGVAVSVTWSSLSPYSLRGQASIRRGTAEPVEGPVVGTGSIDQELTIVGRRQFARQIIKTILPL